MAADARAADGRGAGGRPSAGEPSCLPLVCGGCVAGLWRTTRPSKREEVFSSQVAVPPVVGVSATAHAEALVVALTPASVSGEEAALPPPAAGDEADAAGDTGELAVAPPPACGPAEQVSAAASAALEVAALGFATRGSGGPPGEAAEDSGSTSSEDVDEEAHAAAVGSYRTASSRVSVAIGARADGELGSANAGDEREDEEEEDEWALLFAVATTAAQEAKRQKPQGSVSLEQRSRCHLSIDSSDTPPSSSVALPLPLLPKLQPEEPPSWSAATPRPAGLPTQAEMPLPPVLRQDSSPAASSRQDGLGGGVGARSRSLSDAGADAGAGPAPRGGGAASSSSVVATPAVILDADGSAPRAVTAEGNAPSVGMLDAVPDDPRLVGTWLYGARPARFHISRTQNKGFRFQERFAQGQIVSGILRPRGPWLQATIVFKDGAAVGAIRLRLVEERDGESLRCCMKAPGDVHWSAEIPARRKGRILDIVPPLPEAASVTSGSTIHNTPAAATRPGLAWGVLPGASWWDVGRACCAAQCQLQVEYAFIESPHGGSRPERRPQHPSELRVNLGVEPIVAFTEYRHPVAPPQLGLSHSVWLDHAFAMLEVGVDATWAVCLEKLSDRLEIMAGKREAVQAYAAQYRASGQKRPLREGLPIDERPRQRVGPQVVLVSDLCNWIEGPLAMGWKNYHPAEANGMHVAYELQAFLMKSEGSLADRAVQSVSGQSSQASSAPPQRAAAADAGGLNKDLMLRAVQRNGSALAHAPDHLRADREVVGEALAKDPQALQFAAEELRGDRGVVLPVVQRQGGALKFASLALRRDRDVVRCAVSQDGEALKYASQELRADWAIVRTAVLRATAALCFAEQELQRDRRFILGLVRQEGRALHYTAESLKNDQEIVAAAVRQNGLALQWASRDLRADPAIVGAAVKQCGTALRFAAHALKADAEIVKLAVQTDWRALSLAEPAVASEPEVILSAVRRYWGAFQLAPPELKASREMVLRALEEDWRTLMFASQELRADRDVIFAVVRRHGMALQMAGPEMQADREIVLAAVRQDYTALSFSADALKGDREIITAAVEQHWSTLKHASPELQADREIAAIAVRQSARAFEHVAPSLRADASLWLLAEKGQAPTSPECPDSREEVPVFPVPVIPASRAEPPASRAEPPASLAEPVTGQVEGCHEGSANHPNKSLYSNRELSWRTRLTSHM